MSEQQRTRAGAAVLFVAPVVLLAGLVAHPFVSSYLDPGTIARAVTGAPDRWAWSHLLITVGLALILVGVIVIRHRCREKGEQRWSLAATPLLLAGGTLLSAVAGSDITLAAVATSGQDVLAVLAAGETAVAPLYLGGAVMFATGWLLLAVALHRPPILPPLSRWVTTTALAVVAIALFVPQTSATYAYGAALVVANWLIGYRILAAEPSTPALTSAP